uniref:Uncharacterized protein n=1 Tax=Ditylenchus dipsaci TaxID=166011 RepID=A0A915CPJ7_9BILA
MEFKNPFSMIIFILVLLTSLPCCSAQEEDTQQQPQEAEVHELPVQWYRDEAPPPTSVVNSKAFATPQQRFYDTPVSSPQFVDRNQQYRPPNPPVWNPPANPQYVNSKSGPEPPPGQFSNWPPTQPNQNPYQAPAQRPEEVAYNQQGNQQPQLSFRSPSGQFSSVSSSSQLSLPSGPQNIAYYQPNQPSATPNYGSEYTPSENLGNKRPPVLLIGNFPPRQGAGPNPPQPGATFPYVPTTPLPFVTRYSPPNGPTVRPYATPAAPGEEEYGSPPSPEKGGENPYESPKPSPPAPGFKQPPRPIPLPFPPSPSEDETPPIIPKADVFYPPQKPGEEQPGYETSGGPTPPPGRGQSPSPEQLKIPGQPPSPSKPQVPGQPPRVPGQPPLSEVPCQPPRLPGQPKMPLSRDRRYVSQPPSSEVPCQPPRLPGQPQVPLSPGQEVCQPGQPPQVPGQPPQIPGQTPQIPSQPPQIPGQPPTLSGKPPSPVQPEQPGQPQVPGFPPQDSLEYLVSHLNYLDNHQAYQDSQEYLVSHLKYPDSHLLLDNPSARTATKLSRTAQNTWSTTSNSWSATFSPVSRPTTTFPKPTYSATSIPYLSASRPTSTIQTRISIISSVRVYSSTIYSWTAILAVAARSAYFSTTSTLSAIPSSTTST